MFFYPDDKLRYLRCTFSAQQWGPLPRTGPSWPKCTSPATSQSVSLNSGPQGERRVLGPTLQRLRLARARQQPNPPLLASPVVLFSSLIPRRRRCGATPSSPWTSGWERGGLHSRSSARPPRRMDAASCCRVSAGALPRFPFSLLERSRAFYGGGSVWCDPSSLLSLSQVFSTQRCRFPLRRLAPPISRRPFGTESTSELFAASTSKRRSRGPVMAAKKAAEGEST